MKKREIRYKVSPWLHIYPSGNKAGVLIAEDFFNKKSFQFDESVFLFTLNFCSKLRSKNDILTYLKSEHKVTQREAKLILDQLLTKKLISGDNSPNVEAERKTKYWIKYGWNDALNFHIAIKDYPFLDYETLKAKQVEDDLMRDYMATNPVPRIYKEYNNTKKIPLEKEFSSMDDVDLRKLLIEEVFDYRAQKKPLTKKQVSNLLFYTFGKMGTVEFTPQGEFLLKTSPSGGARHPIEAYPIIIDSEVKKGVYHYSVKKNALEEILPQVNIDEIKELIFELKTNPEFPIRMIILLSAVFPRSMWRYREPRSYRVILHDMGHILETMKIVSKAFGLKTYFGHGFQDDKLEKFLGINGSEESMLKFAVIG
ncbi:MAG TPA: SagB/ThcOx family dehydrogenase [Patescibacteria group bacterium]|nr:SagB/ThcOx family dehydrogenase [Patescibacteria group bacterium]